MAEGRAPATESRDEMASAQEEPSWRVLSRKVPSWSVLSRRVPSRRALSRSVPSWRFYRGLLKRVAAKGVGQMSLFRGGAPFFRIRWITEFLRKNYEFF